MKSNSEPKIFPPVRAAVQALVKGFCEGGKLNAAEGDAFINLLITVFAQQDNFATKLRAMDLAFDEKKIFEPLREYSFDLLMVNFFAADSKELDEAYLESKEWMEIEEKTLDRGTELLNILLYINECAEAEVEISLGDFLKEFLLAEDDLYQDEYPIYEPVLKNQHLAEGDIKDIIAASQHIDNPELKDVFVPMLVFFNDAQSAAEKRGELLKHSLNKANDLAVLMALEEFHKEV